MSRIKRDDEFDAAVADLAKRIGCSQKNIRPCLIAAYEWPREKYNGDHGLTHMARYFVGSELLSIANSAAIATKEFRRWAKDKGIPSGEIEQLMGWFGTKSWQRRGCSKRSPIKRLCFGREYCEWYAKARWRDRPRPDATLTVFYLRGWPANLHEQLGARLAKQALTLYTGLCEFERQNGISPGSKLFFTNAICRKLCLGMAEPTQRRALDALRRIGLIRVSSWGNPREKGQRGEPRTIRRVIPIPRPRA